MSSETFQKLLNSQNSRLIEQQSRFESNVLRCELRKTKIGAM